MAYGGSRIVQRAKEVACSPRGERSVRRWKPGRRLGTALPAPPPAEPGAAMGSSTMGS